MKKILKYILLISFTLALQNQLWQNLSFAQNVWTIIKVAFILSVFEIILKPVIKILLLPINLLTLGLFRIVINTVGLYLAVFLLGDFRVNSIALAPAVWQGISIPALYFTGFWAYVVNSTTQNILLNIFKIILKSKKDKK
jgi:putative membrane protein